MQLVLRQARENPYGCRRLLAENILDIDAELVEDDARYTGKVGKLRRRKPSERRYKPNGVLEHSAYVHAEIFEDDAYVRAKLCQLFC